MKNKCSDVENFNLQIFSHIKIRRNQDPYIYKHKEPDFCKPYVHVLSMCVFPCYDYTEGIPSKCLCTSSSTTHLTGTTWPGHCLHHLDCVFCPITTLLHWVTMCWGHWQKSIPYRAVANGLECLLACFTSRYGHAFFLQSNIDDL